MPDPKDRGELGKGCLVADGQLSSVDSAERAHFRLLSLVKDQGGNILPMAAVGIIVMAALVGGSVDMSRAYRVKNRLQSACDAGVLAGRRAVTNAGFTAAAEAQAVDYFGINYDDSQQSTHNTVFTVGADNPGNTVTGKATTKMDMLVMQLFGQGAMTLSASCQSTMGVGNSDVTMVLDVTGSMGTALGSTTRLGALKTSMKNFYATVATATQGTNARIRYALVPYSTTVNVGQILLDKNPDYLTDSWTIQSRAPVFDTIVERITVGWQNPVSTGGTDQSGEVNTSVQQYSSTRYNSLSACNSAKPANTDWADSGSPRVNTSTQVNGAGQQVVTRTTEQDQVKRTYLCQQSGSKYRIYYYSTVRINYTYEYVTSDPVIEERTRTVFNRWEYRPVTYDTSQFKTFAAVDTPTGNNGTDESSTWDGCIEERRTVPEAAISYSSISGMTPTEALDLDIDTAPDADPTTKWAPLWRKVAYRRNTLAISNTGTLASSACVTRSRTLAEMGQSEFDNYANSLSAGGWTYLDIGLLWGARLSSSDGIFKDEVNDPPANAGNVNRHIIFMTDGFMEPNNTYYQSYGIEFLDRRVSDDGSTGQEAARHSLRFRAICDAVKAKGIRLWVIGFTSSTTLSSDLNYCGSPSSIFKASDAAQLNAAFQEIAKQVGELRVQQ